MASSMQLPAAAQRRKFSFPATLHSTSLLPDSGISARRRLSNVSDAVTRKLSTTIGMGWRTNNIPTQEIVSQGKCLCGQFIRNRLKRAGLFTRKLGLQRLRSIVGTPSGHVVQSVFPVLVAVGIELERMHPRLYTGVTRQAVRGPGAELPTSEAAPALLVAIARELFKTNVTWGKIVSLFSVCGGLSVDCVRQGHPEYLPDLIEGIAEVIEDELASFIGNNGGWSGLIVHCKPEDTDLTRSDYLCMIVGCLAIIILIYIALRTIGSIAIPYIRDIF